MILDLQLATTFKTSGFTLESRFQPQTGITAVVGPNGAGKSTSTIELTRALLYGHKARRGSADDYKNWEGSGTFVIAGETYHIKRGKRDEITDAKGTVLAVGAKEVTAKVEEKMGYGLEVFDICNASVQKRGDLFGKMLPSERKRMIDRVVGLTSNEAVEKACRDEAKGLRREVEALTKLLIAPVEPVKPEGYEPSETLRGQLDTLRKRAREGQAIASRMRPAQEPDTPHTSIKRPNAADIADLESHERDRLEQERDAAHLRATISKAPKESVPYTHLDLNAARDRNAVLVVMQNSVTCPKCGTEFVPGHGEQHLPDGPDLTNSQIVAYERDLRLEQEAQVAQRELDGFAMLADRSAELKAMRDAQRVWDTYDAQLAAAEQQRQINLAAEDELRAFGVIPQDDEIDAVWDKVSKAEAYEHALAVYESAVTKFDELSQQINEKRELAEEFVKGGAALADARATLKAHLAPRLSVVASSILSDMTLGKLGHVIVDEEMNITVNGQHLETLSGGGETVANIALRIALGQVLVARTFPVFLGDEIDADTDSVRRQAVIDAMVGLKDHLKQIILVTHRDVGVADHVFELE